MITNTLLHSSLPLQLLLILLTPVGTLALGDLASRRWLRSTTQNLEERLLVDFVAGTAAVVSVLLFSGLAGVLVSAEFALVALLGACCAYWGYENMSLKRDLSLKHNPLRGFVHGWRPGKLDLAAALVFLGYVVKVCLMVATKPIQDADAMTLYIPAGRAFTMLGKIPVTDPFHFWNTWFEPAVSLLYSWAFTLSGSTQSQAYRIVPLLPFVLLPIAVYAFVLETFKNREAASIALIVTVFMPATDFMLYFYMYYLDAYAILLMLVALTFYRRIPSEGFRAESILGLSLGMALLFKYDIGVFATAFVGLMTVSRMSARPSVVKAIRTVGVAALAAVFVYGGNNTWGVPAGGDVVYFALLVVTGALIVATYRGSFELGVRTKVRSLLAVLLFMLPAIAWGIRSYLVGNSVFGVSLPIVSSSAGGLTKVLVGPTSVAGSFSILTVLMPFVHPWYNVFFFPISIIALLYVTRRQHQSEVVILFLLYFLYYMTVIGDPLSGRHLLFDGILLASMTALLLAEYGPLRARFLRYPILGFYCAASVLAWPTLYYYAVISPYDSVLKIIGLVAFQPTYDASGSLGIFAQSGPLLFAVLGVAIGLGYVLKSKTKSNGSLRKIGTIAFVSIVLVGSFLQFVPYLALASASTNGNVLNFSSTGSYYQGDLNYAKKVGKIVPVNSEIITYNNPALDFTYPRVLDLAKAGPYVLAPIQGKDNANISRFLIKNGFDYLLLPSSTSYQWAAFQAYLAGTPLLQRILADKLVVAVGTGFPSWTLYKVEAPS